MPQKNKLTKDIVLSIIDRYKNGESVSKMSKEYDVDITAIYYQLHKANVKIQSLSECNRKYHIKEDFFNNIDNEKKAYILGLIYADGSHNTKYNTITFSLQEKDRDILDKITNIIQPTKPLMFLKKRKDTHQNQYRLSISNEHISKTLLKYGVIENKSFAIRFPIFIPEHLIHHFVRGYFDGDGCISIYKIKEKYKSCSISIVSNEEFLLSIQDLMVKKLKLNKTKLAKDRRGNNIYSLVYGGKQNCIKIRDWLYKDATIYMERKYKKIYSI